MSLGTSCSSTLRNHSGHCSYGYRRGAFMEIAQNYKRSSETKPELLAGLIKSLCQSVFLSYSDSKIVFFTRSKAINETFYMNKPI